MRRRKDEKGETGQMMAGLEVGNQGQGWQGLADSGTLADMNPRFSGGAPWRTRGWSQQPAGFYTGLAATTLFRARVIYLHLKVRSDRYPETTGLSLAAKVENCAPLSKVSCTWLKSLKCSRILHQPRISAAHPLPMSTLRCQSK